MPSKSERIIIVGGGLGGALLATYLGRSGYDVRVYEMRDDPRSAGIVGGRSINLALSYRGLSALEPVGLADEVLRMAVPMRGRMIHSLSADLRFQPYGVDDSQAINSVSRGGLNVAMLNAASRCANVKLFFGAKCTDVHWEKRTVELLDTSTHRAYVETGDVILSADGAFSAVRRAIQKLDRFDYSQEYLGHGYKELTLPAGRDGSHQLEKNALHIWPRRSFMMIALPNADGSFTCTLFWPFQGANSFDAVRTEAELRGFFDQQFPDAAGLMPDLVEEYFGHPTGSMVTVRCSPWHLGGRLGLLGDAAHAVVPFYGQGMNATFEDVLVLHECLEQCGHDWESALQMYEKARKPNTDALADLAIRNFVEMRDHTGSRWFLFKKKAEKTLAKILAGWYVPLYAMVTFTRIPYAEAIRRAKRQNCIVLAFSVILIVSAAIILWIV